ncbi:hypothetical protein JSCD12_36400 [Clostridioides difficile]|nr:hypothetical protein JSCD12_36400 [Clostridioides difficile]
MGYKSQVYMYCSNLSTSESLTLFFSSLKSIILSSDIFHPPS